MVSKLESDAALCSQCLPELDARGEERFDFDVLHVQALVACEVGELAHQSLQAPQRLQNLFGGLLHWSGGLEVPTPRAAQQELRLHGQRGQRVAEVVYDLGGNGADVGETAAFLSCALQLAQLELRGQALSEVGADTQQARDLSVRIEQRLEAPFDLPFAAVVAHHRTDVAAQLAGLESLGRARPQAGTIAWRDERVHSIGAG